MLEIFIATTFWSQNPSEVSLFKQKKVEENFEIVENIDTFWSQNPTQTNLFKQKKVGEDFVKKEKLEEVWSQDPTTVAFEKVAVKIGEEKELEMKLSAPKEFWSQNPTQWSFSQQIGVVEMDDENVWEELEKQEKLGECRIEEIPLPPSSPPPPPALPPKPKIIPSKIPIQIAVDDFRYDTFREKARKYVNEDLEECAKFVNRLFFARFGIMIFGNAWDMQLSNTYFLKLEWLVPDRDLEPGNPAKLKNYEARIGHFRELYNTLENSKSSIGVIGFAYRFTNYLPSIMATKGTLPQTHVVFSAGPKKFLIENNSDDFQSVEDILIKRFGTIHDYERDFLNEHLELGKILRPWEKYEYDDYLIEEHFKGVHSSSLLEMEMKKHQNNRVSSLFRPVSFSRISDEIIQELNYQKELLEKVTEKFGEIKIVRGKDIPENEIINDEWREALLEYFSIKNPAKALFVPLPVDPIFVKPDGEEVPQEVINNEEQTSFKTKLQQDN
jgi:hypothetical protein